MADLNLLCQIMCAHFVFAGRIHSAVVSGINPETRSVTVEWFERGETKGKEVIYSTAFTVALSKQRLTRN